MYKHPFQASILVQSLVLLAVVFASLGAPRPFLHDHQRLDSHTTSGDSLGQHWIEFHGDDQGHAGLHCHWILGLGENTIPCSHSTQGSLNWFPATSWTSQSSTSSCLSTLTPFRSADQDHLVLLGQHAQQVLSAPPVTPGIPVGPWTSGNLKLTSLLSRWTC